MTVDPGHEAEAFLSLLWRHIYQRVRSMLHPHHQEHEPGGKDVLKLPLGSLSNVTLTTPTTGHALLYDTDHWHNRSLADAINDGLLTLGLNDLSDVIITDVDNRHLLIYDGGYPGAAQQWVNMPLSSVGGGGVHQVHFSVPLPATIVPPGPTNITGADLLIKSVQATTDDSTVAASLNIPSKSVPCARFDYAAGSEPVWADGTTITLTFSDSGLDGTYLAIDIAVA